MQLSHAAHRAQPGEDPAGSDRRIGGANGGLRGRQLRAALDSTPLFGAGRVEDTLNLLGHALRKAVGLAAEALGTSAEVIVEEAGLVLVGQSSLTAALDLDWGEPRARERALCLVLEEVERWKSWLEQQRGAAQEPPMKERMETIAQIVEQETEPDPEGGPEGDSSNTWPTTAVSPSRIRTGATAARVVPKPSTASKNTLLDFDSKVTREVVVCPANEPEYEVVERLAEALEKAPGCCSWTSTWATWPARGVYSGPNRGGTSSLARGRQAVPFSPSTISLLTCAWAGPLSDRPDGADGPRQRRPVSGPCV